MALIWSAKNFAFTALLEGICATLNLFIQALKLHIIHKAEYFLKEVIFYAIMESVNNSEN